MSYSWNALNKMCDKWDKQLDEIAKNLINIPYPFKSRPFSREYCEYCKMLAESYGTDLKFNILNTNEAGSAFYTYDTKTITINFSMFNGLKSYIFEWTFPHELAHHLLHINGCYVIDNKLGSFSLAQNAYLVHRLEEATRKLTVSVVKKYFPHTRYSSKDYLEMPELFYIFDYILHQTDRDLYV